MTIEREIVQRVLAGADRVFSRAEKGLQSAALEFDIENLATAAAEYRLARRMWHDVHLLAGMLDEKAYAQFADHL